MNESESREDYRVRMSEVGVYSNHEPEL